MTHFTEAIGEFSPDKLKDQIVGGLSTWKSAVVDKRDYVDYREHAKSEYDKQFSLWYYWWMLEANEVNGKDLLGILRSDAVRWAAEHVFKVGYREFDYELNEKGLVSMDFAGRSMLSMCAEAVELREQAGVSIDRVEHEGLGVFNLQKLLTHMGSGETAVIMSPPEDGVVGEKERYNMIYIYEKRGDNKVKATAVRDNSSSLLKMREKAGSLSGNSEVWNDVNQVEMVAIPFKTRFGLSDLLEDLGVNLEQEIPNWANSMIERTVDSMWDSLLFGRQDFAKEKFDALQIALFTNKKQSEQIGKKNIAAREAVIIDPLLMVSDEMMWRRAQEEFVRYGGLEMMEERDLCGGVALDLREYDKSNNLMSQLMGINESDVSTTKEIMKCVTCPFCHETVDAEVTSSRITCPKCKKFAEKS